MVAEAAPRSTRGGSGTTRCCDEPTSRLPASSGSPPYVQEFLGRLGLRRFEIMSETAVHEVHDPSIVRIAAGPCGCCTSVGSSEPRGCATSSAHSTSLRDLDVELDVVGDGNDREECEAARGGTRRGLDESRSMARCPATPSTHSTNGADVFVFPSYREPGGNVSLEAMSFGLPLIVCRRGGPGANVDDSCAFRLDADSPGQLAADFAGAIGALVENPDLRRRMGRAARERATSDATVVTARRAGEPRSTRRSCRSRRR